MIKNIVFDMGKVLLDYESMRACRHFIENEVRLASLLDLITSYDHIHSDGIYSAHLQIHECGIVIRGSLQGSEGCA